MVISHQNLHTMKFCLLLSKKIITLRPIFGKYDKNLSMEPTQKFYFFMLLTVPNEENVAALAKIVDCFT